MKKFILLTVIGLFTFLFLITTFRKAQEMSNDGNISNNAIVAEEVKPIAVSAQVLKEINNDFKREIGEVNERKQENQQTIKNFFKRNFYGKTRVSVGYEYQYSGDLKINNQWTEMDHDEIEFLYDRVVSDNKKKTNSSIIINLGYDLYFNINNRINPFIGADVQWRILVSRKVGENYYGGMTFYDEGFMRAVEEKINVRFNEFFRLAGRFGAKFNVYKNFSLEPYALVGANIARIYQQRSYISYIGSEIFERGEWFKNKIDIGAVIGAGFGIIANNKVSVNFEWYRSGNRLSSGDNLIKNKRIRMDNFVIKTSFLF